MTKIFEKDPVSKLDYALDWSTQLSSTDAIATSVFTVPTGLTKEQEYIADGKPVVWLSGGELNQTYEITNSITTDEGREDNRRFLIKIVDL